jgi:hypothetical protein
MLMPLRITAPQFNAVVQLSGGLGSYISDAAEAFGTREIGPKKARTIENKILSSANSVDRDCFMFIVVLPLTE